MGVLQEKSLDWLKAEYDRQMQTHRALPFVGQGGLRMPARKFDYMTELIQEIEKRNLDSAVQQEQERIYDIVNLMQTREKMRRGRQVEHTAT